MKLGVIPENPLERVLLAAGVVPTPLADTMVALLLARTVMTAVQVGVFAALADGPRPAAEVAARCGTDPRATQKLLLALTGAGYVRERRGRYALTRPARRWLVPTAPASLHDAVLHRYLDATLLEHAEQFVRTGVAVSFHQRLTSAQWELYQRGQRAHARLAAAEVVRRLPLPAPPRDMLDLGGGHGYYSVALCRAYPDLRSTVLDLPPAVAQARALVAAEDAAARVTFRSDDALVAALGRERYDLVFVANLLHHFGAESNAALMQRIADALRPGGCCVILEFFRAPAGRRVGQIDALLDFYFALTSASGTWSVAEVTAWLRTAALRAGKPLRLWLSPGQALLVGRKDRQAP